METDKPILKPLEWIGSSKSFQKKSKKGIATPKADVAIVKQRLKTAGDHYQDGYGSTDL